MSFAKKREYPPLFRGEYHGEKKNLLILSRKLAEEYVGDVPYVVISFTTPTYTTLDGVLQEHSEANIPESSNLKGVLRLCFFDVSQESTEYPAMSDFQAQRFAEFVHEKNDEVELYVVHCDAGLCRSPGAGAAISRWVNKDDSFFYKHYRPNNLVNRKCYEQLRKLDRDQN